MEHSNEGPLLTRARSFDLPALAEIYDRYSPGLYGYALRLLGDPNLAEDCVAETFSRFLQALKHGRGPESYLQAYLYRIAHNWITDHYRRQPPTLALDERLPDGGAPPEQHTDERLQQEQVRLALRILTAEQRQVIVLKFLEGWDNSAIAAALEKPVGAIKALQHRGLETLRRMLAAEEVGKDYANPE